MIEVPASILCVKFYTYRITPAIWFPRVEVSANPWRGKRVWELTGWWAWYGATLQWWISPPK